MPLRTVMNMLNFNPRSHEGSDNSGWSSFPFRYISIHAPTRGATFFLEYGQDPYYVFQSTLPRGERHMWKYNTPDVLTFQSTLPRGERHKMHNICMTSLYFNPRSHEGSDNVAGVATKSDKNISIHAPTRGATVTRFIILKHNTDFNPRSHEGSDYFLNYFIPFFCYFNPRSHEGSDQYCFFKL